MSQLYPEEEVLREPRVSTKEKCRPPRRENACDPSWHKHAAARQVSRSTRRKATTSDDTGAPKDDAPIHRKRKATTSDDTSGPKRDPMHKIDGVNVFSYFCFTPESVRDRCLGWEQLFEDERDLYFALGGHHD
ncbi:unnamed protein product [Linum trigynum]|uniref:Uncharacterized protein n=1 Tax=Linum trigynum TaxID=586398 RepID=A0AAV2ET82_9ROSI